MITSISAITMMIAVTRQIVTRIAAQIIRYVSVLLPMFVTALARINSSYAEASTGQVGVIATRVRLTVQKGTPVLIRIVSLVAGFGRKKSVCAEKNIGQNALNIRAVAAILI